MACETPVVIVVRHPDYGNEYQSFGPPIETVDVDLGSQFDGRPENAEQAREWAEGFAETVARLRGTCPEAADALAAIIAEVVAEVDA